MRTFFCKNFGGEFYIFLILASEGSENDLIHKIKREKIIL